MDIETSDNDTDDDAFMEVKAMTMMTIEPSYDDTIEVRVHLEYGNSQGRYSQIYAILVGGSDSCILGKNAKVESYTGRYANLIGYDPSMTKKDKIPIVTGLIKVRSSSLGNLPVILKVHEAPYIEDSPITLLSEYHIGEYRLIIDSVAKKHKATANDNGKQRFQVNPWVHINFEDRGV